jgi:PmbA protein
MESFFRTLGEQVLKAAKGLKVEAEAYMVKSRELSIQVRDGEVETLKQTEEHGMGIRVIKRGRLGFTYTSDFSSKAVRSAVADAASMAEYTSEEEADLFPRGDYVYKALDLYDGGLDNISLGAKIELSRELERIARSSDRRVKITEQSGYDEIEYQVLIMNTRDLYAFKQANLCA